MSCTHERFTAGPALPFTASVAFGSGSNYNPAAHGGVSYVETCDACGARRSVNQNGRHSELGHWGADLATRRELLAAAARKARELIAAVEPVEFQRGEETASIRLDREAMIVIVGAEWRELAPALPDGWLEAAKRAREAVLEEQRIHRWM